LEGANFQPNFVQPVSAHAFCDSDMTETPRDHRQTEL